MPIRYKTYRISFSTHKYNNHVYIGEGIKASLRCCLLASELCVRQEINLGLSTVSIPSQGHSGFAVPSASLTRYAASASKQSRRCIAPPVNQNCPFQYLCVAAYRQRRSVFGMEQGSEPNVSPVGCRRSRNEASESIETSRGLKRPREALCDD